MRGQSIARELNKRNTLRSRIEWSKENLPLPIGKGSGRIVFPISNGRVIKLAKNLKGVDQNRVESDSKIMGYTFTPKIYTIGSNFCFLESERARSIGILEFMRIVGCTPKEFTKKIIYRIKGRADNPNTLSRRGSIFLEKVVLMTEEMYLSPYDFIYISTYGVSRDGRILVVDCGLSENVFLTHYKR